MSRSFAMPADLAEIINTHRALFGGFVMEVETTDGGDGGDGGSSGDGEQPKSAGPFTEGDPAWLAGRLERERAKFADYDDLKAKASKLDEIEQASKSELEKAVARAEQAEKERSDALTQSLRWKVAAKHGIADEDAELFLTATDEDTLTKQAERLAGKHQKKRDTYVSGQGNNPRPTNSEEATAVRQLFASGN